MMPEATYMVKTTNYSLQLSFQEPALESNQFIYVHLLQSHDR